MIESRCIPPTLAQLQSVDHQIWRDFGRKLREHDVATAHEALWSLGARAFEPACRVIRTRALRAAQTPAADILRMFWIADPVPRERAEAALGSLVAAFERANVLQPKEAGLVSPLRFDRHAGLLILAEDLGRGGDAVMGLGPLTPILARAVSPERSTGSLLDLGCGAGYVGLSLATRFQRVVSVDLNPRATVLTAANALLGEVTNVETRAGDLYAPVASELFDRIACQPPFMLAFDEHTQEDVAKSGGAHGDEIALRAMADAHQHLAPEGYAVFLLNWVLTADARTIQERVRAVVPEQADVLVIELGELDAEAIAIGNAMHHDPTLGAAYERDVLGRLDHLERLGITALKPAAVVIARAGDRRGWSATFEMSSAPEAELASRDVRAWLRSRDAIAAGPSVLTQSRFTLRQDVELARVADGSIRVERTASCPIPRIAFGGPTADLLDRIRRAKDGGDFVRRYVKDSRVPASVSTKAALGALEAFLASGLLEIGA